jgi:putative acetyltransferase
MITIQTIQPHQHRAARQVLLTVCQELWGVSEEVVLQHDPLHDLDDIKNYYFEQNGTFIAALDGDRVVGTLGVRHWRGDICELKRLWFYKEYRGQGLGRLMMERLINFAVAKGYQRARFEVADPEVQAQAMKLYHKLGFYFIERYSDGPGTVFMEKVLQENASESIPALKQAA